MYERKLFPEQQRKKDYTSFDVFFKEVFIEDLITPR